MPSLQDEHTFSPLQQIQSGIDNLLANLPFEGKTSRVAMSQQFVVELTRESREVRLINYDLQRVERVYRTLTLPQEQTQGSEWVTICLPSTKYITLLSSVLCHF